MKQIMQFTASTSLWRWGRALTWVMALVMAASVSSAFGITPAAPLGIQEVRYGAHLDPGVVKLGGQARLMITVENSNNAKVVSLPEVDGLRFGKVGRPSSRSSIIQNGRRNVVSSSLSWVVLVQPDAVGEFSIPPVTLSISGREYETRELVLKVREDLKGAELGHLSFSNPPKRVFEGEAFTLDLKFGWEMAIDESIGGADLSLPWWDDLPGVLEVEEKKSIQGQGIRINLNSRSEVVVIKTDPEEIDGKLMRTFRLRKRLVATRPGELEFPTSFLEFVQVIESGVRRMFGSTPDKTESFFVSAEPFSIMVEALPEEGRPFEFSGGVGRFEARATVDRRDVDVGDSIKLSVEWTGPGNLEFFELPELGRLEEFSDFQVFGTVDRFSADGRRVIYDIAPRFDRITEIPGVPLVVFNSERGEYVTIRTEPIPIRVRALDGASPLEFSGGSEDEIDIIDLRELPAGLPPAARSFGGLFIAGMLFAIPLLWLGLRTAVRKGGRPDSIQARRRRGARRVLAKRLAAAEGAREQSLALAEFLGARTNEAPEAWRGRDLRPWFERQRESEQPGLQQATFEELVRVQADLDQRGYAGSNEALDTGKILNLADSLAKGGL